MGGAKVALADWVNPLAIGTAWHQGNREDGFSSCARFAANLTGVASIRGFLVVVPITQEMLLNRFNEDSNMIVLACYNNQVLVVLEDSVLDAFVLESSPKCARKWKSGPES
jgi:hypothetical protein